MEVDTYGALGAYHWDEYARDTPYARHARRVARWITERPVLDVGCGDGLITALLAERGEAEGIDRDPRAVELAQARGVRATVGSAESLRGQWAAIYCGDTLEHLDQPARALRRWRRCAPVLYLATPPRHAGPHRDHRHRQEWRPAELRQLVEGCGWRQVSSEIADFRILAKFVRVPWWRRWLIAWYRCWRGHRQ